MDIQTLTALMGIITGIILIQIEEEIDVIPTKIEERSISTFDLNFEPPPTIKLYDWDTIAKEAHICICGETGAGKSTLARRLMHLLPGKFCIIDPHGRPSDWEGLPVTGAGRDYPAIENKILALTGEMERRYKSDDRTQDTINVIVDEVPAIAANCSNWAPNFAALVREGRKVGIRLIILTQGSEVAALGMKGANQLKESLCMILLGRFAEARARILQSKKLLPEGFRFPDRPILVRDIPAVPPA